MRSARVLLTAVVLAAALAPARPGLASPEDIFGYGSRSPGMGATGPASADGFEAAYANPALLAGLRDRKFTLGFQGASFHLTANGPGLPGLIPYDEAKGVTHETSHGRTVAPPLPPCKAHRLRSSDLPVPVLG